VRDLPKFSDPNLVVGPEGGSDAGVYRLRDDLLIVQSLDFFPPLVDDPYVYGQIAAANSLSDVFAMGARPVTALNIVGFPDDQLPLEILAEILRGGGEKVKEAGAVVPGGHTVRDVEIKYGLSVTGIVEPEKLFKNSTARPGDVLVLTKPLGTGFVTTAFKAGRCPDETLQAACASMTQLNSIGRDAAHTCRAHSVTDITGFGLAGHAFEMAEASGVTIEIEVGRLPLLAGALELVNKSNTTRASASNRQFVSQSLRIADGVDAVRQEFVFDAQTSGGLLISLPPESVEDMLQRVRAAGAIQASLVGRVTARGAATLVLVP
jgi:selenide,water dikinase